MNVIMCAPYTTASKTLIDIGIGIILVQISFLKNGNLDSKKLLKGRFSNPKAQNPHK